MEVEIALDLVAELLDLDALCRRVVGVPDRVAEGEGLEDEFDRVRTCVCAEKDGWLIADQLERLRALRGRSAGVLELADLALVAPPALPGAPARNVNFATLASACTAPTVATRRSTSTPLRFAIVAIESSCR